MTVLREAMAGEWIPAVRKTVPMPAGGGGRQPPAKPRGSGEASPRLKHDLWPPENLRPFVASNSPSSKAACQEATPTKVYPPGSSAVPPLKNPTPNGGGGGLVGPHHISNQSFRYCTTWQKACTTNGTTSPPFPTIQSVCFSVFLLPFFGDCFVIDNRSEKRLCLL